MYKHIFTKIYKTKRNEIIKFLFSIKLSFSVYFICFLFHFRSVQRAIRVAERGGQRQRESERELAENAITFSLNISRESGGNVVGVGIDSKLRKVNKNRIGLGKNCESSV